jgi:C4-dicarboxylate transporter DctQ subunit
MFMVIYRFMDWLWQKTEIVMTVTILTVMTLVSFSYTMINNLYAFFFYLEARLPFGQSVFASIGDYLMDISYSMKFSNALTAACFAWLMFFGMSYGVRVGSHIGVDALVKLFKTPVQRLISFIGLSACLLYAGLFLYGSLSGVVLAYKLGTAATDLEQMHILAWHISVIVPIGFILVIIRYLEIGYRLITHQQVGLGLADEATDALKLQEGPQS